jgi:hypothetical protein
MGELKFPIFNASLEPGRGLHVHYGHAEFDGGKRKPVIEEWRDGGSLSPLGMFIGKTYFSGMSQEQPTSPDQGTITPVSVYDAYDASADCRLLRHPKGVRNVNRSLSSRGRANLTTTLFSRLGDQPVLVYGTRGTPAENAALLARARFDQQLYWYRTAMVPVLG